MVSVRSIILQGFFFSFRPVCQYRGKVSVCIDRGNGRGSGLRTMAAPYQTANFTDFKHEELPRRGDNLANCKLATWWLRPLLSIGHSMEQPSAHKGEQIHAKGR